MERRRGTARRAAAVLAVGLALAGGAPEAWGHGCDRTDNDAAEADRVIRRIARMETRFIDELRLQTEQLSGYIDAGARAVIEGLTGQTKAQAQMLREELETRAAMGRAPSLVGCRSASGAIGAVAAGEVAGRVRARTNAVETARLAGDGEAMGYEAGEDAGARYRRIVAAYGPEGPMPYADIAWETLHGTRKLASDEEAWAALDYARNLVRPAALAPPGEADSPGDVRRALARRAADARAGLASAWTTRAIAARRPAVEMGAWAEAVAPGAVAEGAAVSERELMYALAVSRTASPEYQAALSGLGTEELLREIARNQAVALWIAMVRFEMDEHRGSMEAARLALEVEAARGRAGGGPGG